MRKLIAKENCPFCEKPREDCECRIMEYHDTSGEDCLFGESSKLTESEFSQRLLREYQELREENAKLKQEVVELKEWIDELQAELEETPTEPAYDWRELD